MSPTPALPAAASPPLPRRRAWLLFSIVILVWGLNWVITKSIVRSVPPLWTSAIRSAIACATLLPLQLVRRDLIVPRREDLPVVVAIGLLHMVGFSVLVAAGLRHAPVGRSIVLGYTTPLWVAPLAWVFLGEAVSRRTLLGIAGATLGLVLMFNPVSVDWHDHQTLTGNALILLASWCWAASIVYVRKHRWIATPWQLVLWEALLAACVTGALAAWVEGRPAIVWSPALAAAFCYAGACGTALAYWAMATINRSLPATTTALGMLLTPIAGLMASALFLGERPDALLLGSATLILLGIGLGATRTSLRSGAAGKAHAVAGPGR